MWILPKQLISAFVPDTEALISDLNGQSQACEQSLLARSKPLPARTWLQKWKRDFWMQHLSGRILKPSHGDSFVIAWISSLEAIPASHLAQPESDWEQKIPVTSGLISQAELELCAPESASLKTSKDTSPSDSEQSLQNWNQWVMRCRGEYSVRLKSALHINASECLSWPTPDVAQASKVSNRPNYGQLELANHPAVHGYEVQRKKMEKSGQPAQASPNTNGSRQESWATPRTEHDSGKHQGKADTLHSQIKQWATPRSGKTTGENLETWMKRQAKGGCGDNAVDGSSNGKNRKWQTQPSVGGISDGIAGGMDYAELCVSCDNRTDELRLIGNGVVPATAEKAFRTLMGKLL